MPKRTKFSKEQLLKKYDDPDLRERVVELLDLRSYLLHCVIRGSYKISDALNKCITLSEYGDETLREFGKKQISIKEGRLICFLSFFHMDLLIDPELMDPKQLASAITEEIREGRILLPFAFGPGLYERAAHLFPDERSYLGTLDTQRLLEDTPVGVFQMGRWVSGPFGILASRENRSLRPTLRLPLQHCHDVGCRTVHSVQLMTDSTAPVNEYRNAATRVLEAQSEEPSEFGSFFSEIAKDLARSYDDYHSGTLPLLVGDAFSDRELTCLLVRLMDHTEGNFRASLQQIGCEGSAEKWVADRDRAELLQQIFLATDREILRALDELVFSGEVEVPPGEVRRSVLYRGSASGAFGIRAELSALGVRLAGPSDLAPMRMRRLVERLYVGRGSDAVDSRLIQDTEELGWQLRGVSGVNLAARLDEYLRTESPDRVLQRLVLARRENVTVALDDLGLSSGCDDIDDSVLVKRMLWKLGFECETVDELQGRFSTLQNRMSHAVRSASVSTIIDWEAMRGLAANYFVALEELLSDTLAFATWVLTTDHVMARHPFEYDSTVHRTAAFDTLTAFHSGYVSEGIEPYVYGEKATLHPLCAGFGVLADLLSGFQKRSESMLRDQNAFPEFAGYTKLQQFPFAHTCLFLDLVPTSQRQVLEILRGASKRMVSASVPDVRNEQLHYRRSHGDLDRMLACLASVDQAMKLLEDGGFTRTLYYPDRREQDRWGRRTVYFSDRHDREIALGQPSSFAWLNLPPLRRPQYLVGSAQFAEQNEIVRVGLANSSEFTRLWQNFPLRRESSSRDQSLGHDAREASGQREPQATPA